MDTYITYDYELCMGAKTGTPEGCLVEPMKALTRMFDRYHIKTTIFVDAAYLLKMDELRHQYEQVEKDFQTVINHVKELSEAGHSIQLHYHPQWLYAKYIDRKWSLDNDHYKLSDLPLEVQKQEIEKAILFLNNLTGKQVCAFRAGGFSIENFVDIADIFNKYGVMYDMSVLRGAKVESKYQTYDYTKVPKTTHYHFSDKVSREDTTGKFVEFPIAVKPLNSIVYFIKRNLFRHLFLRNLKRNFSPERWNDGIGVGHSGSKSSIMLQKVKRLLSTSPLYASADGSLVLFLPEVYKYSKQNYIGSDFVIIGHPKIASPLTIHLLENFIVNHQNEIQFKTIDNYEA